MIKWEVTLMELKDNGIKFKVTRRIPELSISETEYLTLKKRL
jgi:hypothetical protein